MGWKNWYAFCPSSIRNKFLHIWQLAHAKVTEAAANPHTGSGTPVLDANGVLGSSIAVGAVFGGIFIAFVVRAKQAKKTY